MLENQQKFRDQVSLLSALVRQDAQGLERLKSLGLKEGHAFAGFAVYNQLGCYLFDLLSRQQVLEQCPPRLAKRVSRQRQRQENVTARSIPELARLAGIFAESGCPFMLLKGMYWSERFHGGPNRRNSWDIDLLVPQNQASHAQEIMKRAGFQRQAQNLLGARLAQPFTHGCDYRRGNHAIDLHWLIARHPSYRIDYQALWRDKGKFRLGQQDYAVLSESFDLVLLLLSIVRDIERGALRMKLFVDLYHMLLSLQGNLDWENFFDRRGAEGLEAICTNTLWYFMDVFDCIENFPLVVAALRKRESLIDRPKDPFCLLLPSRFGIPNKRWVAQLHDTNAAAYYGWWALSLPFKTIRRKKKKKPKRVSPTSS